MLLDPADPRSEPAWRPSCSARPRGRPALQGRAAGLAAGDPHRADRRALPRRSRSWRGAARPRRGRGWTGPAGGRGRSPVRGRRGRAVGRASATTAPVTEYGRVARLQLVASLQVHVAVGGAERTLRGLQRAARPPARARRAGRQRPDLRGPRHRHGLGAPEDRRAPSAPGSAAADRELGGSSPSELRWGAASGAVAEPRLWWWELRPHPGFGTLEIRVPDAQTTLADAAGVVALRAGAGRLAGGAPRRRRAARGAVPDWRIEENRWSAARHGVEGEMADLETGERRADPRAPRAPARRARARSAAPRLGGAAAAGARELVERERRDAPARAGAQRGAATASTAWLADRFPRPVEPAPGSEMPRARVDESTMPKLPQPRGEISERLLDALPRAATPIEPPRVDAARAARRRGPQPLALRLLRALTTAASTRSTRPGSGSRR